MTKDIRANEIDEMDRASGAPASCVVLCLVSWQ